MIVCEAGLCIYNDDSQCTRNTVEIESSGRCYQHMTVSLSEETLDFISKETLCSLKKDFLKVETELWEKRLSEGAVYPYIQSR